jgi:hypothetical protein
MHAFEWMYLGFGSFITLSGITMVVTYSVTNPWWRSHLGRMMITYAVAEILMSTLLMVSVVAHFSPLWFRGVWFALQVTVGVTFCFQTSTILRLHRAKRERESETV